MDKTVVITGASKGIGYETAKLFFDKGWSVYGMSRTIHEDAPFRQYPVDVTDASAVSASIERIIEEAGRIDILITAAGMGIAGPIEESDMADDRYQFDVNFFGTLAAIKAILPHMRERREGRILLIASVAAEFPIPYQVLYSATKAAVKALALGLAGEVKPFGIQVAAVLPGDTKTSFTAARKKVDYGKSAYKERYKASVERMEKDEENGVSAAFVAGKLYALAAGRMKLSVTLGFSFRVLTVIARFLPERFIRNIIGRIYG